MLTIDIQGLASEYTETVMRDGKIGAIMAIRYYGECLAQKRSVRLDRIERFYDSLKPLLTDAYRTKLSHLSSHEVLAVEQAIAINVYNTIQNMLAGCVR